MSITSGTIISPGVGSSLTTPLNLAPTESATLTVNGGGVLSTQKISDNSQAFAASSFTLNINGGTINATGSDLLFGDGGGGAELAVNIGAGATINVPSGITSTSQRPISNIFGQVGTLTKTGSGALNLSGVSSYTGQTLIKSGTVRISSDANLGAVPNAPVANQLELNGGALSFSSALSSVGVTAYSSGSATTIASVSVTGGTGVWVKLDNKILGITGPTGGTGLNLSNAGVYIGAPDMPGGVQATAVPIFSAGGITGYTVTNPGSGYSVAPTIYLVNPSNSTDYNTVPGPSGSFVLTYALSGSNPLLWSEGIIPSGSTPSLTFNNSAGTTGTFTTTSSLALAANRGIQLDGSGGTLDVATYSSGFVATVNGPISGVGTLSKTGGGILVLTNTTNSWSGGTIIGGGILEAPSASVLPNYATALSVQAGGALGLAYGGPNDWTSSQVDGLLSGTSFAAGSGLALDTTNLSGTYSTNISNPISLTKLGSNTLTLGGSNSYTYGTVIDGGVLALANPNALGTTGTISFGGGILQGTLQYSGSNTTDYSSRITSAGGAIAIDTSNQTVTFSSPFIGTNTNGFTKYGAGTLTMAFVDNGGGNHTPPYLSGQITINGGTLKLGPASDPWDGTYGGALVPVVINSGTYDINGTEIWTGLITSTNSAALVINNGSAESSLLFAGAAGITGTYAGGFLSGSKPLDLDYRGNGGTNLTLTGSSNFNQFHIGNNAGGGITIGPGGYVSDSFQSVGENITGSFLIINGGILQLQDPNNGGLRIGWNGSGSVTLNSGTITAPFINRSGGSTGSDFLTMNGGVINTKQITNDQYASAGMTFTLNSGTINNTNNDVLFRDSGQSAANELLVQIGANGGTINTNGFTTISERLMNVSGSSSAGPLTITGAGSMNLTGTGSYTGNTLITGGGTVKISRDGNLGVAPPSTIANQVEINGGTLNFSSMLTGATMTGSTGVLTSASNYAINGSSMIGSPTVTNVTGGLVKLNNTITALVGGTGANGGSGYTGVTIAIAAPDMPGGIQATASAAVTNGTITGYSITNPGSGYSYPPLFSINYATHPNGSVNASIPTYQFALTGSNPVIWSEGIVTAAPVLSISGYASSPTLAVTTSTSVTLASTRGIHSMQRRHLGCIQIPE